MRFGGLANGYPARMILTLKSVQVQLFLVHSFDGFATITADTACAIPKKCGTVQYY